jgi:hypothetical protein
MDIFEKLLKEQINELYSAEVDLTVWGLTNDEDKADQDKVRLNYAIEIEHKSWGINGINIIPKGIIAFDIKNQDDEAIPIKVDLEKENVKIQYIPGKVIVPTEVEVTMGDIAGRIKEVEITFYIIGSD